MQRFFSSFLAIRRFFENLRCRRNQLQCNHCHQAGQMVSHGFVYKKCFNQQKQTIGKRIICSRRYGRNGCGRTVQIYLAQFIPQAHYSLKIIATFLKAVCAGKSVATAYQQATGQQNTRNAWRWINQCCQNQINYRAFLNQQNKNSDLRTYNTIFLRSRRQQILLPVIAQLLALPYPDPCKQLQLCLQEAFI